MVGAGPMILNFLQACWIYSVYLTMREREMVIYLILLLGQIAQCITMLFAGNVRAYQTGGLIGNATACGILLVLNGRALWKFHESGGLHGKSRDGAVPLLDKDDETNDGGDADLSNLPDEAPSPTDLEKE